MFEKLNARLGLYMALAFPQDYKPSADEFRDEIERRQQLGEVYSGHLGFTRVIGDTEPTKPMKKDIINVPIEKETIDVPIEKNIDCTPIKSLDQL